MDIIITPKLGLAVSAVPTSQLKRRQLNSAMV
jgi:hypothetical protein